MFSKNKLIVRDVNLTHENHLCDQQTFDHYPENLRLDETNLKIAQQMIAVGGNKQKIKMFLTKKTGKTVMLQTLHNIQSKDRIAKNVGPESELTKLYEILKIIPNANVTFISDDDNMLVGKDL